jgi:hypothetical protein
MQLYECLPTLIIQIKVQNVISTHEAPFHPLQSLSSRRGNHNSKLEQQGFFFTHFCLIHRELCNMDFCVSGFFLSLSTFVSPLPAPLLLPSLLVYWKGIKCQYKEKKYLGG